MKSDYSKLRELLLDEESKKIFDARVEYMQTEDTVTFIKKMHGLYGSYQYSMLDDFLGDRKQTPLVIFGAGYEGEIAVEILRHTKYASWMYAFCDNNRELWGKTKCNLPIVSIYDLLKGKKEYVFILASWTYNIHFLRQLQRLNIPQRNIFVAPYGGFLFAKRGWQYFDVFQPTEHEVFVDAGAYDGMTSKDFLLWCQGKYNKIFMFEPNADMEYFCLSNLEISDNVEFRGKGLWTKDTYLKFNNSQDSSSVEEVPCNSKEYDFVQVCSIDSELKDENVTFIKMDIEGSELKALQGAQKTIKSLKPRMAISVYHKLDDIINIMDYLFKLNPEYRYYLRHYSACQWETVLYAI